MFSKEAQTILTLAAHILALRTELEQAELELEKRISKSSVEVTKVGAKPTTNKRETDILHALSKHPGLTTNGLRDMLGGGYYTIQKLLKGLESRKMVHKTTVKVKGKTSQGWAVTVNKLRLVEAA